MKSALRRGPRVARFALPLLAALVAAGCVSAPERSLDEAGVEPPERWAAADAAGAPASAIEREGSERALLSAWPASFGDAGLLEALAEALRANQDLRAAAARVMQAEATARIAGADLYPSLGASARYNRQRNVLIGIPIPNAPDPLAVTSTSYGVSLDVSWEPDLWGRVRNARAAAVSELFATRAELEAARLSIAGQTAKAWFALTEARLQEELARELAESFARSAERIRERYELGLVDPLDLRLARNQQHAAEATLAARANQVQATRRQLEVLLGRYPAGLAEGAPDLPAPPGPVPAGLPAELVARRPDLVAAERRLEASGFRAAEAEAARYPSLSLTASGGTSTEEFSDLLDGDFRVWSLVGQVVAPLFQGGRLAANEERALARQDESLARFAAAALDAYREVESALASERHLAARQAALELSVEQALAAERLAEERYREGLVEILTVLEAQRRSATARVDLLALRRERLVQRVDLHLALGGGFTLEPGKPAPAEGAPSPAPLAALAPAATPAASATEAPRR